MSFALVAEQALDVRGGDPRLRGDSFDPHRMNADDAEQIESALTIASRRSFAEDLMRTLLELPPFPADSSSSTKRAHERHVEFDFQRAARSEQTAHRRSWLADNFAFHSTGQSVDHCPHSVRTLAW